LNSRSNGHILTKDIPVSSQDAISFFAKHTVSHLHNVINIMQRVSKRPNIFHAIHSYVRMVAVHPNASLDEPLPKLLLLGATT
jgi:hypothetical protein